LAPINAYGQTKLILENINQDNIPVYDLAYAHVKPIQKMIKNSILSTTINLGSGIVSSIMDIIKKTEEGTGKCVKYKINNRRIGDPLKLVSSILKARKITWSLQYSILDHIISFALKW